MEIYDTKKLAANSPNTIMFIIQRLGGDIIAQCGENYHLNLARVEDGKEEHKLDVDWKRAGEFSRVRNKLHSIGMIV
jgi:hypothetical protein